MELYKRSGHNWTIAWRIVLTTGWPESQVAPGFIRSVNECSKSIGGEEQFRTPTPTISHSSTRWVTEIWNAESLNSTLHQIAFYRDSVTFEKEEEAQLLFDRLLDLLLHLEAQVEAGVKFAMGEPASSGSAAYRVFVNEVMLGDNMIYVDNGQVRVVFVDHGVINYIGTTDDHFTAETFRNLQNIMQKSMLISGTGEEERHRFFRTMCEEVERRRK